MVKQIWMAILVTSSLAAVCWDASVDYIYWKASGSDLPWLSSRGPNPGESPRFTGLLSADYESGVRVEASVGDWCGWSLVGRYYWVEFNDNPRFDKPTGFVLQVIGQPTIAAVTASATAAASQTIPVHMADLFAAYPISGGCWGSLELLTGATFLYARRTVTARYLEPILQVLPFQARNRFVGAGPMLGLRNIYYAYSCFDVVAELSLLTVFGEISNRQVINTTVGGAVIVQGPHTVTGGTVGGQTRLGCQFHIDRCRARWSAALGWEQRLYLQVTATGARNDFLQTAEDDTAMRNLFIGGPYIGLGVGF